MKRNTPQSPKSDGRYKRDKIGVTTIGSSNIIILLMDIFNVLSNNVLDFYLVNNLYQIYIL